MSDVALQPLNIGPSLNNGILNQMSLRSGILAFNMYSLTLAGRKMWLSLETERKKSLWKIKLGIFDSGK